MLTNNHKKQTASSNTSSTSSQEATASEDALPTTVNGENTSPNGVSSDTLLSSLAKLAHELHGQSKGVVERLCETIVETIQGQVQLILPGYQYRHTYMTSSREHPWFSLPVEHAGRSYGKLEVAPHPAQPGQTALPYHHVQWLASYCSLLLYSLETAAYFQREYPSPLKQAKEVTPRERDILDLLCHGYSRKQIASLLDIEYDTVVKMCGSLNKHLNVTGERHAIAAAFILGLSSPIEHLSPQITPPSTRQET